MKLAPIAVMLTVLLAGCAKAPPQMQMPTPEVGVLVAHAQSVPLTRDLVGRLSPTRSADVRARVAGVLLKRLYKEGSDVKQGEVLFQIDPAPLQAALDAALASLAQGQATAANAKVTAERNRELLGQGLVSRSNVDDAAALERSSAAQVQQAQANVELARLNLSYARVTAPISGRSGQQRVTEGALVGQGEATLLTTVEQIDPLYVNFSQAIADMDRLRRAQANGHVELADGATTKVDLVLADGKLYPHDGTLDFSDAAVDASTGSVALRGVVPNPERTLLPGMFVNVRLSSGQQTAFRVPAAAVQRDDKGFFVMVVDAAEKAIPKHVTTDRLDGDVWIVMDGIAEGDRLIVSGLQKARPDAPVKASPWQPDTASPPAGAGAPVQH